MNAEVGGEIRAGESLAFTLQIPRGHYGTVLVHQQEIDIAVEWDGETSDATEWGDEAIYVASGADGRPTIRLIAHADGPLRGQYRIRFARQFANSEDFATALRAARIDMEGNRLLEQYDAKTLSDAAALYGTSAELWKRVGDLRREGHALARCGIAHERLQHYSRADDLYLRALRALKAAGDRAALLGREKSWLNLGGRFGEERAGIDQLANGVARAKELGDLRLVAMYANSLGSAYGKAQNRKLNERFKLEYVEIARKLGDLSMLADALNKVARLSMEIKEYEEAIRYGSESIRLARQLGNSGEELAGLGLIAVASGYLQDHTTEAETLEQIRSLHARRGDLGSLILATIALGDSYRRQGRFDESWERFTEALESHRRFRDKAVTMSEQLIGPASADFVMNLAHLSGASPAHAERAFLAADWVRGVPVRPRLTISDAGLHEALGGETTLVTFVANPQHEGAGYVWLTTREQTVGLKTAAAAMMTDVIARTVATVSSPTARLTASTTSRDALSQTYLAPLKGRLKTRNLVIVPDEALTGIPFSLLPHPDYTDGSLLGDHHIVTYAPSGQAILSRSVPPPAKGGGKFLIAGDPVTNRLDALSRAHAESSPPREDWTDTTRASGDDQQHLPRLAFAAAESKAVQREAIDYQVKTLLGFGATREQLLRELPAADVGHLIAHGLVDLQTPRHSGLALTSWNRNGKPQEGLLRLEEIASMRLRARLITLSACDTSIGKVLAHYGVPSLSNAFLRAGAARVVSTLWKVDDAATASLMTHFYRNLFSTRLPPGEALWKAQLEIRKQKRWSNPYYWAGFTLSGDWRAL